MTLFTELVFDQIVRGNTEVYSSSKFEELLGSAYDLTLEVESEETTGTPADITVKLHHSNSGKGFVQLATLINASTGITSPPYRSIASQAGPFARQVRVGITLGSGSSPTARVRVWATGRSHS